MTAGMFLSPQEVREITERKYHKYQRKVLADKQIPFDTSTSGRPLVLRALYERRHHQAHQPINEPDFASIIARYGKAG